MNYELLKSLHLIFIVTWFAGLFYIVRLFIYHTEVSENKDLSPEQKSALITYFTLMQRRLWYGITWPSAIITLFFGLSLIPFLTPLTHHPWLLVKLGFVTGLYLYHFSCHFIYKKLSQNQFVVSPTFLRIWNEVATIFLVAIIFLAVYKNTVGFLQGIIGLVVFTIVLMLAISIYKKIRSS